jgi:hypothetical protein
MEYQTQFSFLTKGRFALVDAHFRNIWLTIDNQDHAHIIRNVFRGKLSLLVCDLSVFENFQSLQNEITSHTCTSWQLPATSNTILITPSMANPLFDQTQTEYHSFDCNSLINKPATCLLDQTRQLELQDQLLLYNRILELTEIANSTSAESLQFIDQINKIFSVEIHISDIIDQLYQLTTQYIGRVNVLPSCILDTLGKSLYE